MSKGSGNALSANKANVTIGMATYMKMFAFAGMNQARPMGLGMMGIIAGFCGNTIRDYFFRGETEAEEGKLEPTEPNGTEQEEPASSLCENESEVKLEEFMKSLAGFEIYKLKDGRIVQFHCRKKIVFEERWKTVLVTEEVVSWDMEDPDVPKHIKELLEKDAVLVTEKE